MAKNLHIGMLAEGVETREQEQFLKSLGCHEMQGFLFSKPLTDEQVSTEIRKLDVLLKLAGVESGNNISAIGRSATG